MKIAILGGGISGLSAAHFLKKKYEGAQITLFEKEKRVGGMIETHTHPDFLFEKGARTFIDTKSPNLLALIKDVGLEDELIYADQSARNRYLWSDQKLRSLTSFLPRLIFSLALRSLRRTKIDKDESIASFGRRKWGSFLTDRLLDAMTLGIYGGDIEKLSMKSCFPFFYEKKKKKRSRFFTLKNGMDSLIRKLQENVNIQYGHEIKEIEKGEFDLVVSALPGHVLGKITNEWVDFETVDLSVIHFVYDGNLELKKGFGYLVPTREKEKLLGCIFESSLFPGQGKKGYTRITAILRENDEAYLKEALFRHLGIQKEPIFSRGAWISHAIPQFHVGYEKRLAQFEETLSRKYPYLKVVGNYFSNPSVEGCIARAYNELF